MSDDIREDELPIPNYATGNHISDENMVAIKVLEGVFKNTVFSVEKVVLLHESQDIDVNYHIELFCIDDFVHARPSRNLIELFEEGTLKPILHELVSDALSPQKNTKET